MKDKIIKEILMERERQDRKWGQQNHPSIFGPTDINQDGTHNDNARSAWKTYAIPAEQNAKDMCDNAFRMGAGSWGHIALEEFSEVICAPNEKLRRGEIVQLAAVLVAWLENIDRNNK